LKLAEDLVSNGYLTASGNYGNWYTIDKSLEKNKKALELFKTFNCLKKLKVSINFS
jgi:hypothetical protein